MQRPDLVVIHSPVGGGHKAAALATVEAAQRRGLSTVLLDTFEHAAKIVGDTYLRAHLTGQAAFPDQYGSAFFAANHRGGAFEPVRRGVDAALFSNLVHHVHDLAPRAVVATHHLPLVVLGRARRYGWLEAPLFAVITDYTSHACWVERGVDGFFAPCARARHELILHGADPTKIEVTGIPIRAEFHATPAVVSPKSGEILRILVTSGGFGVGPLAAIVKSFRNVKNVALTVVCGNAPDAVRRVEREAEKFGVAAKVIGFEKKMFERVAEAHLVVGKAGGLTVTECMAAGRPMLIVGAVPGNEKLNEEFVVRGGAGLAPEASRVGAYVEAIRDADLLEEMGRRARELVPRDSAERVVDRVSAAARSDMAA